MVTLDTLMHVTASRGGDDAPAWPPVLPSHAKNHRAVYDETNTQASFGKPARETLAEKKARTGRVAPPAGGALAARREREKLKLDEAAATMGTGASFMSLAIPEYHDPNEPRPRAPKQPSGVQVWSAF